MYGENDRDSGNGGGTAAHFASNPTSPVMPSTGDDAVNGATNTSTAPPKAVEDVKYSDIGITTLLARLKQSIASARDFAQFLKKRAALEEEQASGCKRLVRIQLDSIRKADVRGGSYAAQLAEVLHVHERMADNGIQFALSLHQMHEDLDVLSNNMERGRKNWKHEGLDAEKRASDAEAAMLKAKAKYDSLAEDHDRARTGDVKGSRRLGLKGPKSAEQYEQDLLRKTQAADADYEEKVGLAKSQREQLLSVGRPQAVKALQELIHECDSGLTLQLQKFATFNEKLLLGNGLAVSPLAENDGALPQRSLRDLISDIDNERDYHNYVSSFSGKVQAPSEIKYEQHPTLVPKPPPPPSQQPHVSSGNPMSQPALAFSLLGNQNNSPSDRFAPQTGQQPLPPPPKENLPYQQQPDPQSLAYRQAAQPSYASQPPPPVSNYGSPPYPTHGNEFAQHTGGALPTLPTAPMVSTGAMGPPRGGPMSPPQSTPARPVFGLSLEELFARDNSAVPTIVVQCMQAVDLFGLDVEGIYRVSGNATHVNALRNAFDTLPPGAPQLDFRNPANFFHDVNAVTTLLKQFLRELSDPLFTRAGYTHFIESAKIDDADKRRDALHQGINDLPDPNYATMRALVLHLYRVMQNESRTRMGSANLAVCFAPSLMGQHTGAQIADAGLQAKVVDTILINATAIFDED